MDQTSEILNQNKPLSLELFLLGGFFFFLLVCSFCFVFTMMGKVTETQGFHNHVSTVLTVMLFITENVKSGWAR